MLPTLSLGPLVVKVPGLILLIGLWFGLSLAERNSKNHGVNASILYNLVLITLISGVIMARLTYAARFPEAFFSRPLDLLSLNPGLLDLSGGVAGGIISALIFGGRKKLPLRGSFDALTPLFAVLGIALGLAHLSSGDAFGAPADLPWAIELWGARRHPSQIYETIAAISILLITWSDRLILPPRTSGARFLNFLAWSSAARLFLEAFRGDSVILFAGIRSAQLIAWSVLALCLIGLGKLHLPEKPEKSL